VEATGEYSNGREIIRVTPVESIVVVVGFAGLWSAVGATRQLDGRGIGTDEVGITVVNCDSWHAIRMRNYDADLSAVRVPLPNVLKLIGIGLVEGDADADADELHWEVRCGKHRRRPHHPPLRRSGAGRQEPALQAKN